MTETPVSILQKAGDLGFKLGFAPPDTLTVDAAKPCPGDLAETLRAHKPALLALLRLPFVMLYSKILEETIFFCQDEDTRAALVDAGAESSEVYTRAELEVIVKANRTSPLSPAELRKIHQIKRSFNPRITR